jgi:hypothetical protein
MAGEDGGSSHLVRIARFQLALLPVGAAAWGFRSWKAALVFAVGGGASILFWNLHRWVVAGMLTPSLRRRWLFGFLVLAKLALIVLLLRGMMVYFPLEVLPFVTGILLFSASIVMEACWLVLRPD